MKRSNSPLILVLGLLWTSLLSACISTPLDVATEQDPKISSGTSPLATNNPKPTITNTATPAPTPALTPTRLACWDAGGEISEGHISSELLPKQLDFMLYLPPCYRQQLERRYPVLYLIHGSNFTHEQWDRIGADEMADALIAAGEISPFIIVMPYDRLGREPPANPFGEALIAELIPWIDENYRTLNEREFRAIGGLSRGGAWAVHLGLGHWELFGVVGAHSMALFWDDSADIPKWLAEMQPAGTPRIFVDVGRKDFEVIRTSSAWFGDLLAGMDIPHEWYSFAGTHEETYWRSHLEQYIRFYTLEW